MVGYTTSQPWSGPKPPGVREFGVDEAKSLGQDRAFTLDLRRLAFLPVPEEWFPYLRRPGKGIVGRADRTLRQELEAPLLSILKLRPETIERLGPLWSSSSRP